MRTARIAVHSLSCSVEMFYHHFLLRDGPADLARVLAGHLRELGGTFLLVGEVLSLRRDCFPPAFCEGLASLKDATPPLATAVAIQTVEHELGRPIHELFSAFEKSASGGDWLGQTYTAEITDDDPVVVTVRRPGLTSMVETDLAALRVIVDFIDFLGVLGRVRLGSQFEAFRRHTLENLSLVTEGRKTDRLAAQTDANPRQYVPQVYWSHTTPNVLTMERVDGTPLDEIVSAAAGADSLVSRPGQEPAAQIDLSIIARNLLYNHLHQILNGKYVHCSPVPALLAVLVDNTIVYRDCRAVERLDSRFSQQQLEVISAARAGDVDSLFRSLWDWVEGPYDAPVEFEASFHRRVSEWLDSMDDRQAAPSERNVRRLLAGIIDDFRRFQIAAPAGLLAYYHAFAITTVTVEILAPNLEIDAELAGFFQAMLTERIEKKIDTHTLSHTVLEYEQFLVALPHQFREFMRQVRQSQSPVVRTVDVWELRGWSLLQLLTTLAILAIAAAWLWPQWSGAGLMGVRIPATVFITAICSLFVLRRVCRLRYDQCAMGSRKMRRP